MKIFYISGTRADYELMREPLLAIRRSRKFDLQIVVTGMHLRRKYGSTMQEIEEDHFPIVARLDTLHSRDDCKAMTVSLGKTIVQMAELFDRKKPDLVFVMGDRDEQLAGAVAASHLNIPVAHIHAGERSGSIDESNRHAISKYASLFFVSTKESRMRLIRMGEESFRIHNVGAPAIDAYRKADLSDLAEVAREIGVELQRKNYIVLLQHAVTQEVMEADKQIRETLGAVRAFNMSCVALIPNSDPGGAKIGKTLQQSAASNDLTLITHLRHQQYGTLLKNAAVLVGNSSSGIIEAPYLELPVVNIGTRQQLRTRGRNVIDVPYERKAILSALRRANTQAFRARMHESRYIYGDGHASIKIVSVLASLRNKEGLFLQKKLTY